ncbi:MULTISPECIES: DUF2280 domain-containing protein [Pseudomonas]|jgi:hypothetical protein|uniref:DUF2280 domain-containing protein n=1 Tax=Pseudomonas TaxID=286 RepID=UPI0003480E1C|nr:MULTISPECIES: DUF2280 domain-containing protein [Pseudomonas]MBJ2345567.1 DUF2280 domain-containing protein [Pseudomonas canavaninivorans]MBL3544669.1 DUF2280 domain-containing protein [Pseudomonas sp. HB05]NHN67432.1 DUF2280 domain-containing protein [Pseudomonas fluorescens]
MAALKDEVKRFIVQSLACFDTPSQVAQAVKDTFGLEVSRQQCEFYDPTKYAGRDLSLKWRTVFEDTRKRFREETAEIPIANRAFRLRALNRFVEKAESMKNISLAMQILEQAAKETGDMYVNRSRKEEPDDEPAVPTRIQVDVVDARKPNAEP